jgi:hypothetical protein
MTYYGYSATFTFIFSCGCTKKKGPILEKFAYQYAQLGKKQTCPEHGGVEVDRKVAKHGEPHGWKELGFWRREDGRMIFLTWTPASGWVDLWELGDGVDPDNVNIGSFRDIRHLVNIPKERTIWTVVGGDVGTATHLGGDWPEPAEEVLARLRDAASSSAQG